MSNLRCQNETKCEWRLRCEDWRRVTSTGDQEHTVIAQKRWRRRDINTLKRQQGQISARREKLDWLKKKQLKQKMKILLKISRTNHSFETDLFNESVDLLQKKNNLLIKFKCKLINPISFFNNSHCVYTEHEWYDKLNTTIKLWFCLPWMQYIAKDKYSTVAFNSSKCSCFFWHRGQMDLKCLLCHSQCIHVVAAAKWVTRSRPLQFQK